MSMPVIMKGHLPEPEKLKNGPFFTLISLATGVPRDELIKDYEEYYKEYSKKEKKEKAHKTYTLLELMKVLKPGMVAVTKIDDETIEVTVNEHGQLVFADNPNELVPLHADVIQATYVLKQQERILVSYHTALEAFKKGETVEVDYEDFSLRFIPGEDNPLLTMEAILEGAWYVVR
jgi:hypothetical protein